MKWGNAYRNELGATGQYILQTFDNLWAAITGAWKVEHTDDDQHGHVHAQTIQTGRISYSNIIEATFSASSVDNFDDPRLRDAAMIRVTTALDPAVLTGIQVPVDETGAILDGRVLTLENASLGYVVAIDHESTASSPANRIIIPHTPTLQTGLTARYFIEGATIITLIYNKAKSRWILQGQGNEGIESYTELTGSVNDYGPIDYRATATWKIVPTAANLTISGFHSPFVMAPSKRTIINEGAHTFAILHMSTSSNAANRVQCPGGTKYYLHPREAVDLYRDTNDTWYIKSKADQYIDVTYNAANFTASSGTWTVGNQITYAYQIDGNVMTVWYEFHACTITGGAATELYFPIPAGRVCARSTRVLNQSFNAFAANTGVTTVTAGEAFFRNYAAMAAPAWAVTAGGCYVLGQITFPVLTDCAGVAELHTDVAHSDTAHADGGHSDVAFVNGAHSDSHSDVAHADGGHSDIAFVNVAHSDVAFVNGAHGDGHTDAAHGDTHDDSHTDTPHGDGHQDDHFDSHEDFNDGGAHVDSHDDTGHNDNHEDTPFSDSHGDSHGDGAHGDDHNDVAHSDTAHSDTAHGDTAHSDGAHADTAHSDSHSDVVHGDVAHTDSAHGDTAHSDSPHQDVGLHCDTSHTDIE